MATSWRDSSLMEVMLMLRFPASSHQEIMMADLDFHIEPTSLHRRASTGSTQTSLFGPMS
jgi:hypothetical protein